MAIYPLNTAEITAAVAQGRLGTPIAFARYTKEVADRDDMAHQYGCRTWFRTPDGYARIIMTCDDAGLFAKAWIQRHNMAMGWLPRDPETPRGRYIHLAIVYKRWCILKWLMDGYFESPV